VDGPDPADVIVYYVFPTAADARNDLAHPSLSGGDFHVIGKVAGYSIPSEMAAGSISGKNAFGKDVTNGVTGAFVAKGNVIVGGVTVSVDNAESGMSLRLFRSCARAEAPRDRQLVAIRLPRRVAPASSSWKRRVAGSSPSPTAAPPAGTAPPSAPQPRIRGCARRSRPTVPARRRTTRTSSTRTGAPRMTSSGSACRSE
jgi:hypothetical protein